MIQDVCTSYKQRRMGDKEPETKPLSKSHSKRKSREKGEPNGMASVKSHPVEPMGFRVLRDSSVSKLGPSLKMTVKETESQFWNRKLGTLFWRRVSMEKETKNKETQS